MTSFPRWRKTGRKAPEEHHRGLDRRALIELVGPDDSFKQQGSVQACRTVVGEESDIKHGRVFMRHVIACQDQYHEQWVNATYGVYRIGRVAPNTFAATHVSRCNAYRDVSHADVLKVLTVDMFDRIKWLTPQHKTRLIPYPEYASQSQVGHPDHAGDDTEKEWEQALMR